MEHYDLLIIGSGPAGLTAGIYGARSGLKTAVAAGMQRGGQLTITPHVENFPGFPEKVNGAELMELMEKQAANMGAKIISDTITKVDFKVRPFKLLGDDGAEYTATTVVIATGAKPRWLGLESEQKFMGTGVSACATCDGFFFKNKRVCVVGGGSAAVEEALYLAGLASHVTLIHRRDALRAEKVLQERLKSNEKISVEWDSQVVEILGTDTPRKVTGVQLKNTKTGAGKILPLDGVFVAIGHQPNSQVFKGAVDMDDEGYIITAADSTKTNIEGVFAAGDVQDRVFRQAVTSAGTGCKAAIEAQAMFDKCFQSKDAC